MCVCTSMPLSRDAAATSRHSDSLHDKMNRGASEIRMRPAPAPWKRSASASAESIALRDVSIRRVGTRSPWSISALPITARMPDCSSTLAVTSVMCTVPMSLIDVTPPASSSHTASRADAAIEASVCAASSGQMLSRSQRSRSACSASPRNSVWHRWRWPWTNPGSTKPPRASMVSSARAPGSAARAAGTVAPTAAMVPSRTSRSPRAIAPVASMHTRVPEVMRVVVMARTGECSTRVIAP